MESTNGLALWCMATAAYWCVTGGATAADDSEKMEQETWTQMKTHVTVHGPAPAPGNDDVKDLPPLSPRSEHWAAVAFDVLRSSWCGTAAWTQPQECERAQRTPRHLMTVWVAGPRADGAQLVARLPDGALERNGRYDGMVMLDPSPRASWGHLVFVLGIHVNDSLEDCDRRGGYWTPAAADCMTVVHKRRCRNQLVRWGRRRRYRRRCEIILPPLVVSEDDLRRPRDVSRSLQSLQELHCRSDVPGFAPCSRLRPLNATERLACDPLGYNRKHSCSVRSASSMRSRCRFLQTCDHGVLLSGGWSRQLSPLQAWRDLRYLYDMLRRNGFHKANIRIFFANGEDKSSDPELGHIIYPSSSKLIIRHHLQGLCATPLCTDALVIYLAGPVFNDGSLLLWDASRDGLASEGEVYTVRELLHDLRSCAARQVTVLVDTSYAGEIVKAFKHSKKHKNVQVFSVSGSNEYSWNSEFVRHWAFYSHSHSCTHQAFRASLSAVRDSTPRWHDGSGGTLRRTLFGAPCDATPPFTWSELHTRYFGCQNTPMALWLKYFAHFQMPKMYGVFKGGV